RAVDAGLPLAALAGQAQPADGAVVAGPLAEDAEAVGAPGHQRLEGAAAERAAVGQQVDGFEQAGLAGAVAAEDQRATGRRGEVQRGKGAEVLQPQPVQVHGGGAGRDRPASGAGYRRSGMTTWRQRSSPSSRTSALELASRSDS